MSRFFALPVLAAMLALAGVRMMTASAPKAEGTPGIVVSLPIQESDVPRAENGTFVTPQEIWEPPPAAAPAVPAPKPEPVVVIAEPAPVVRTEVVERTVVVPQTTVIYAPTINYYPVAEPAPEPKREGDETPVVIFVCPTHHRSGCCPPQAPKRPAPQPQDTFFKTIPFMPATAKSPRFNP